MTNTFIVFSACIHLKRTNKMQIKHKHYCWIQVGCVFGNKNTILICVGLIFCSVRKPEAGLRQSQEFTLKQLTNC